MRLANRVITTLALAISGAIFFVGCGNSTVLPSGNSSEASPPNKAVEKAAGKPKGELSACALLTKSEAAEALGVPVKDAQPSKEVEEAKRIAGKDAQGELSICTYDSVAESFNESSVVKTSDKTITLMVRRMYVNDNTPEAIAASRQTLQSMSDRELQDVSGVGDTAFWAAASFLGQRQMQLIVFKGGNLYLQVYLLGMKDEAEALRKAKTVAQKALDQL